MRIGQASFGGRAKPARRFGEILFLTGAIGIGDGKIVHRLAVASLGRFFIPAAGLLRVRGHAATLFVERRQAVLRHSHACLRCLLQPAGGFAVVQRNAVAICVFQAEQKLRLCVACIGFGLKSHQRRSRNRRSQGPGRSRKIQTAGGVVGRRRRGSNASRAPVPWRRLCVKARTESPHQEEPRRQHQEDNQYLRDKNVSIALRGIGAAAVRQWVYAAGLGRAPGLGEIIQHHRFGRQRLRRERRAFVNVIRLGLSHAFLVRIILEDPRRTRWRDDVGRRRGLRQR